MTAVPHTFAPGVCSGPEPQPGDLIRVTRTEVRPKRTVIETHEGFFVEIDVRERASSGWSWLHAVDSYSRMRLRDQGPVEFGTSDGGFYVESDLIEVLEARDGAPFEHILLEAKATRDAKRDEERDAEAQHRKDRHWIRRLLRRISAGRA